MPIFNLFYKEVLLIVLRCNVFFCFGEQTFYINFFFKKKGKKKKKQKKYVPSFPLENPVVESEASLCCGPKGIKLLCVTSLL